jgi:hypothetical protein
LKTKKSSKKPIWVYDDLHGQNFYFFLGHSAEELQKWVNTMWLPDWKSIGYCSAKTIEFTHPSGGAVYAVWCPEFQKMKPKSMELLVHEITHAAFFSMGIRGFKTTHEDHEELAYLTGYLVRKVLEQL